MPKSPIIAFGQQPCGFFPRRFLVAKVWTARRLQRELGGEIVFFYHDADHDPRETQTGLRHLKTDELQRFNFTFQNKLQRKYSPLYCKRLVEGWQANLPRQLGAYLEADAIALLKSVQAETLADFCLDMYRAMGMLEGVRVVRSSDPVVRQAACTIDDYYVDVPCDGEIVRARRLDGELKLHEGGPSFRTLPSCEFTSAQIGPARDSRLRWMQSVIGCTHYIAGAGEQAYLRPADAPDISFVRRDDIDRSDEAYTKIPI
jgi:hypothetical protein